MEEYYLSDEPLLLAIREDNMEMFDFFSTQSDINETGESGYTPLTLSIRLGKFDFVQFLVKRNVNVNKEDENCGYPLFTALQYDQDDIFFYLVENGAHLQVWNEDGESLLDFAIKKDNIPIANYLLDNTENINYLLIFKILCSGDQSLLEALRKRNVDFTVRDHFDDSLLTRILTYNCFHYNSIDLLYEEGVVPTKEDIDEIISVGNLKVLSRTLELRI